MSDLPSPTARHLGAAHAAAHAARREILPRFRAQVAVSRKEAHSPIVTEADREAERAMRAVLAEATPEAGVEGEELGIERPEAPWRWVLDPIDGTIAFACGKPLFTTLIGLLHEGRPVLGVIDQAVLGERWVGHTGGTTYRRDAAGPEVPVRVRGEVPLAEARVASTSPRMFRHDPAAIHRLTAAVHVISWGGDAYNYGALDAVIEAELERHDYAALLPIVRGAGGLFTDQTGVPITHVTGPQRVVASGAPELHEALLACLQASDEPSPG